jgi:hypothetical protein
MDPGEIEGVDCDELPGTSTDGYSRAGGLGGILQNTVDTGPDATGVILFGYCAGVFGEDFVSKPRRLSAASLSCMLMVAEYGSKEVDCQLRNLAVEDYKGRVEAQLVDRVGGGAFAVCAYRQRQ